ncbi:MAG TPA: peroxiredoxin [Albidovulum sp.]|uniref:peroxiredoxin n=1 Tax=Albidovulum sp. TaxID=1872424 RepID=UPI002BCB1A76|nr:peroxiredoxin [Albidovulum sp.]
MVISVGDRLPEATLLTIGANGPEAVELGARLKGRKVVIFGLPGAFTGTCTTAHVPSYIRTKPGFDEKGVDEVICLTVNDPFVVKAWTEATGAAEAGIVTLADAESAFTAAIGMAFSAPAVGFVNRSKRYSLYAEDGVVKVFNLEVARGGCEISAGETLLGQI